MKMFYFDPDIRNKHPFPSLNFMELKSCTNMTSSQNINMGSSLPFTF